MANLTIVSGIFLGDLLIKNRVEKSRELSREKPVLGGRIILSRYHNEGAMLNLMHRRKGLVAGASVLLTGIALIQAAVSAGKEAPLERAGMSFLLGGALSNTFDRLVRGHVVDYFSFACRWKRFRNIVFNLSDMFLFAGVFLTALGQILKIEDATK